jgi:hypothetical protein
LAPSGLLEVEAVDGDFAGLDPPNHLSQVRIFYLQGITDQRSSLSWYGTIAQEQSSTSLKSSIDDVRSDAVRFDVEGFDVVGFKLNAPSPLLPIPLSLHFPRLGVDVSSRGVTTL